MKKTPTGKEYRALLFEELAHLLPSGFQKTDASYPCFTRRQPGRTERIGLELKTKHWPYGRINLNFGVAYDEFQPLFDAVVNHHGLGISHIYSGTTDVHQMQGLRYLPRIAFTKLPFVWRLINLGHWPCYRDESPKKAIRRTKGAIKGVIEPFFRRFSDIREAWCSLRENDGWSQGRSYGSVLAFGVYLADWEGVEKARARIIRNYDDEGIAKVDEYLQRLRDFLKTTPTKG